MAISDVYQLTDIQTYGTQEVENVWFFEKLSPDGTAADLIEGFLATYMPAIRQIQAQGIVHTEIKVINLGDLGDFEDMPVSLAGLAGAGDTMPSFVAIGYTLKPATRAVRPGSKRIVGVLEAALVNGVITEPTFVANVEALRIVLDDNAVGSLSEYQPVIVKRIKEPVVGTTPQQYTYRLPHTGDPLTLGLVKQALTNPRATSQVSRKF